MPPWPRARPTSPALYRSCMDTVLTSPVPALPRGEGSFLALLWTTLLEHVRSASSASEESPLATHIKACAADFGGYVLEAEDRADIIFRVDTLLDDPAFCQRFYGGLDLPSVVKSFGPDTGTAGPPRDWHVNAFGQSLGPAAVPYLREIQRSTAAVFAWLRYVAAHVPAEELAGAANVLLADPPLGFLSSAPVPIARALLATLRCDVLALTSASLVFQRRSIAPWLGLALAEIWATELREYLVLCASIGGTDVPYDLVPPDKRFNVAALDRAAALTDRAYKQFDSEAESSGEPIYPPAP